MSKGKEKFDFNVGIFTFAPAKQEAYKGNKIDGKELKEVSNAIKDFQDTYRKVVNQEIKNSKTTKKFPTKKAVCIFIIQFFSSEKEYNKRDVDNMAKTILDTLKSVVYENDSQVKTLLIAKRICDNRIKDNFLYLAVREQDKSEGFITKSAGLETAYNLYSKHKKISKK